MNPDSAPKLTEIRYLSEWSEVNPENDNIDVHVLLSDGREFTVVVATPNNLFWCMDNGGVDYFIGGPMIFVKRLTKENVEAAVRSLIPENDGHWIDIYMPRPRT
jgi:hypothetical protein